MRHVSVIGRGPANERALDVVATAEGLDLLSKGSIEAGFLRVYVVPPATSPEDAVAAVKTALGDHAASYEISYAG
jgi:hypothetical protein